MSVLLCSVLEDHLVVAGAGSAVGASGVMSTSGAIGSLLTLGSTLSLHLGVLEQAAGLLHELAHSGIALGVGGVVAGSAVGASSAGSTSCAVATVGAGGVVGAVSQA